MAKVEVLKTYIGRDGKNWHLLQTLEDEVKKHTIVASNKQCIVGDKFDISLRAYKFFEWAEFQNVSLNFSSEDESGDSRVVLI